MRSEIKAIQVAEPKALFGRASKINKCCHKNVIVLSDSGAAQSFLLLAYADISGKESRTKKVELSVWSRILVNPRRDDESAGAEMTPSPTVKFRDRCLNTRC